LVETVSPDCHVFVVWPNPRPMTAGML
jgi:hypothetical protein